MKKLKKKMILSVFVSLVIVFSLTLFATSVFMRLYSTFVADGVTELIENYGGKMPEFRIFEQREPGSDRPFMRIDDESQYTTRYFTVYLDDDNSPENADVSHIAAVDESDALGMAQTVLNGRESKVGYCGEYRYRVTDGSYIIFLDCSDDFDNLRASVLIIAIVSIVFMTLITLIFAFISKRAVRPFEENSRRQKRFITDASHELKTPLAIISANAEVLAYKDGGNEWLDNITSQIDYMGKLINELLTLTRLEELEKPAFGEVDYSAVTREVCDSFSGVFEQKRVTAEYSIEDGIEIVANADQLRRLVSVLIENASKYVTEGGQVRVSLKRESRHTDLTVFNSCETDGDFDYERLFDRFYRPDSSRSTSTGGHGIGLSIAKTITQLHNGSIYAKPSEGGIVFTAVVSNKLRKTSPNREDKI